MNSEQAIDAAVAAGYSQERDGLTANEYQGLWFVGLQDATPGSVGAAVLVIDPTTGKSARFPPVSADELVQMFRDQQQNG